MKIISKINKMKIIILATYILLKEKIGNKKRRFWVHELWKLRKQQGAYDNLIQELLKDSTNFKKYTRLTIKEYNTLLILVESRLKKKCNREPLCPSLRLILTLRYLVTGNSMVSMSYEYRVGVATVSNIINECCDAIWEVLAPKEFSVSKQDDWIRVADGFYERWNFPNCVGAIDGKHIQIQSPYKSISQYDSNKKKTSVVLLATCDANLRFINVDIGNYSSDIDGGILKNSVFGQRLLNNSLNLPPNAALPCTYDNKKCPFWIIGDNAFPLRENLMTPICGRSLSENDKIFNYRLSRARSCIDRAFRMLVYRWRIFTHKIIAAPATVDRIIKAAVVLHNFILSNRKEEEMDDNDYDRSDNMCYKHSLLQPKEYIGNGLRFGSRNSKGHIYEMRNRLKNYFVENDPLPT